MKDKYYVGEDDDGVWVSMIPSTPSNDGYLNSFINIWVDDEKGSIPSPFKNKKDAKLFAEILVKLLNKVGETDDIE